MQRFFSTVILSGALLQLSLVSVGFAQKSSPEGIAFFEQKIRPILAKHCYECHSADATAAKKLKGGLLLDSADGMLKGGDTGPALVKSKSGESLLVKALKFDGLEMPPTGKLPDEIIADFAKWIDMGAPDPRLESASLPGKRQIDLEEGRKFWSFQPLGSPTPPVTSGAETKSPVDQFVLAKQLEHGIKPNVSASREKLIRRVYFDLVGLPPTPEQVDAFVQDKDANAFEKVIDALLQSERYGERWARDWLDVARYAESGGYEFDGFRPGAYHYRDWVIRCSTVTCRTTNSCGCNSRAISFNRTIITQPRRPGFSLPDLIPARSRRRPSSGFATISSTIC